MSTEKYARILLVICAYTYDEDSKQRETNEEQGAKNVLNAFQE